MRPAAHAPAPCAFMDELVGLLDGRCGAALADGLAVRLDRLRVEAHRHGAPEATVEAIDSARALSRLAEAPVVFVVRAGAIH